MACSKLALASGILSSLLCTTSITNVAIASETGSNEQNNGLSDIVVTATRRSENLQEVPLSVSAVNAEQLESRGLVLTNELATIAPNVNVNSQYGETQPNFTIRGVGVANEFNVNAASPVAVYVDEVYKSFRFTHGQSLFDLERLEVLRGPQGTLFGRNTTGGAINLITRKPSLSGVNGYVTAGYGNYDRYKIEGAVEVTAVEDALGFRLAATRTKQDGFFKEVNPAGSLRGASSYQAADSYAIRAAIRAKIGENLDINISGQFGSEDPIGPARFALGVVPNGTGGFVDYSGYSRFTDPLIASDDQFHMNELGKFKTRSRSGIANIAWNNGGPVTITSVTGYTSGVFDLEDESDGGPNSLVGIHYRATTRDFSQDLRMNYDTDALKVIVGVYYGTDRLRASNQLGFFGFLPDATSPATFNGGGLDPSRPGTSFRVLQSYGQDRKSKAAYGEINYTFSPKLDLTVGLRYTDDSIKYVDGSSIIYSNFTSTGQALFPLFAALNQQSGSKKLSGRAILNYNVSDDVHAYVSFSRGQRSGTYNGFAYADPTQVYFVPPEQLDAYEAGIKSRFLDDRLQINGAIFHYDYKGQQVQEIRGVVGFLTSVDAKVDGAELEVLARPVRDLTLRGSIGYLDARYVGGSVVAGINIGGNKLPFAPSFTGNAGFDLTAARLSVGNLVVSGEAQYSGLIWYDIFNNDQSPPPGFTRQRPLNQKAFTLLSGRIALVNEAFTLAVWGKNLTNKKYYPAGYNVEGGTGLDFAIRGSPRTYGMEATFRF